ncbi:GGDEF domain-containing protein [Hansschlegelia sp.]|uniref:GGDEF domain-containing protein n=1 Tax=Hansschlegelia sp. TaxID=2041892 RepID=UPI002B827817|nr:GGDEF domain-containing protein [Hansschlegelia sp.]HVI28477.1 GGDEF domain-containing protein [Hansschlegelia sp.]
MFAYARNVIAPLLRRFGAFVSSQAAALPLSYAAAFATARLYGEGAGDGRPPLALAAPVALGVLLRFGRGLELRDAAALAAAHAAVATACGDALAVWLPALAHAILMIASGSAAFLWMRGSGRLTSPLRIAAAAALIAIIAPLAATLVDLVVLPGDWLTRLLAAASRWVGESVSTVFVLGVILSYGREESVAPGPEFDVEPAPRLWEYAAAALLTAALTLAATSQASAMFSIAASAALLWFALRIGPFATNVAAFAFFCALIAFAERGHWPPLFDTNGVLREDLLRYFSLALLGAPSIIVAAVVHDQKRLKRMFAYRAMHDGLTTLVNRSRFVDALDAAMAAARNRGKRFTLLLIDLDHFKGVNDTYGHARGDSLLIEVADRLRSSVRVTDLVARIGGDEFAVVAPVPSASDAASLAKRLVEMVNQPCDLGGVVVTPSITVGGALAPDSATDPQHLMLLADEALYEAKAAGRNCWRFNASERGEIPQPTWRPGDLDAAAETIYLD